MNIFKNRPLCLATVCFILVGFVCLLLPLVVKIIFGCCFLVGAVVFLVLTIRGRRTLTVFLLLLLCGVQCILSCLAINLPLSRTEKLNQTTAATDAYVKNVLHKGDGYFIYSVKTISVAGETFGTTCSVTTNVAMNPGQRFTADLTYYTYSPAEVLTHSYDFANGIYCEAEAESDITFTGTKSSPFILASKCRDFLSAFLDRSFSTDAAALLRAMLLGDRTGLSPQTSLSFYRTGITHLLALSGTHITMLTAAILRILTLLRVPNRPRIVITIVFVILYSMLVGMPLSILRASCMAIVLLLGMLIRRERDALTSLSFAILVILLFSPRAILDVGFWMSATATLGILIAFEYKIGVIQKEGWYFRILNIFLASLVMTLSASLFTLPITAFIFGELSLLSLPANLIFPSLMNLLIYLGLTAIPLPFLRPLTNFAVDGYLWALGKFGSVRGIILSLEGIPFRIFLVLTTIAVLILLIAKLRRPKRMLIPIGILFAGMLISTAIPHIILRKTEAISYISDAKYNDFVVTQSDGRNMVYVSSSFSSFDAGSLAVELHTHGIHEVDILCFSHYHSNFSSYLKRLSGEILISEIMFPPAYNETEKLYANETVTACVELGYSLSHFTWETPLRCGNATMTTLPRSLTDEHGNHAAIGATFTLGEHNICCLSAGYYQSLPMSQAEEVLNALQSNILIFGNHGNARQRSLPAVYPLDEHVTTIVFRTSDKRMIFDRDKGEDIEFQRCEKHYGVQNMRFKN